MLFVGGCVFNSGFCLLMCSISFNISFRIGIEVGLFFRDRVLQSIILSIGLIFLCFRLLFRYRIDFGFLRRMIFLFSVVFYAFDFISCFVCFKWIDVCTGITFFLISRCASCIGSAALFIPVAVVIPIAIWRLLFRIRYQTFIGLFLLYLLYLLSRYLVVLDVFLDIFVLLPLGHIHATLNIGNTLLQVRDLVYRKWAEQLCKISEHLLQLFILSTKILAALFQRLMLRVDWWQTLA